ncbi:MAG: alpha/beta hydrolase [Eubacteriales bacterium]|jgi:pimeloyl-ACP methyl ester carboxylesterase|nr:alpha/beta hydrolase [Eubacteriales bacterium]MDD3572232.1 alpha/beta hydrolase [Eubacteriales bacterium]MDD4133979.1 alpha/beta hydrolase [Eubacteriales bacterium]NLO13614.1 alpha/beta hydrolase [Clostridiales bacterium]
MSTFTFEGRSVYYEVAGTGRPLLMLNGIMMSTKSWEPFLQAITKSGSQPVLVDLLDQGQSEPMGKDFPIILQAKMLEAFLAHLGLLRVDVFGTSYGGEVALNLAALRPDLISRMVLANTVARTNAWLKEIGEAWILAGNNPRAYYATTIPVIYSPDFYDRRALWMENRKNLLTGTAFASSDFQARMARLTRSAESHDVTNQLDKITCPVLLLSSQQDHITPPEEQAFLHECLPNAELVFLPKTGHASFYERPDLFTALLTGFLSHRDPIQLP